METIELLKSEYTRRSLSGSPSYEEHEVQHAERVSIGDLSCISCDEFFRMGFGNWDGSMMLLPLWSLGLIAKGEVLGCIDGNAYTVGTDQIDTETRGGCIAYGFLHPGLQQYRSLEKDVA